MTNFQIRTILPDLSKLLFVLSTILFSYGASASDLTTPNVFSAGSAAVADEVNANFSAVETAVNDNDARIAALEMGPGDLTFQASDAHVFGTSIAVPGAGTLLRSGNSLDLRVQMSGLDTNAAYTLWWIIFNNPEECTTGAAPALCGSGDLDPDRDGAGINPVDRGVRNAAAFLTGLDGTANIVARLHEGPAPTGPAAAGFGQLNDSVGAEIHIVIQTHGAPLAGSVATQMTIPGGVCNPDCEDQFAIVFLPL